MLVRTGATFQLSGGELPYEGGGERNNVRVILTVTDSKGLTGTATLRLAKKGWQQVFPNTPPIPNFVFTGSLRVGQPVAFDATSTVDNQGDRIDYNWDFGDGFKGVGVTTTHFYNLPGAYIVSLTTNDNWNEVSTLAETVTITVLTAISPVVDPDAGLVFDAINVTFSSVQNNAAIYFTIDNSVPTTASTLYNNVPLSLPFTPNVDVTVKARAFVPNVVGSPVITNVYSFKYPPCASLGIDPVCGLVCVNSLSLTRQLAISSTLTIAGKVPTNVNYVEDVPKVNNFENYFLVKRFLAQHITGTYNPTKQFARLALYADAGTAPAQCIKAKISFDFDNNGVFDHYEISELKALDDVDKNFELYRFDTFAIAFPNPAAQFVGQYRNLLDGTVMLEVWQPLGSVPIRLLSGGPNSIGQLSAIEIPFDNVIQIAPSVCGRKIC
jgi:hypothetical protein